MRAWSSAIVESIPLQQHGAVPGRSIHQLVAELATDIEYGKEFGVELQGISYDYKKFFDALPHVLIGPVLTAAGAPPQWATRFLQFVQREMFRYKFMDRMTTPTYTRSRGVPQGDAFSVVTFLLMLVARRLLL